LILFCSFAIPLLHIIPLESTTIVIPRLIDNRNHPSLLDSITFEKSISNHSNEREVRNSMQESSYPQYTPGTLFNFSRQVLLSNLSENFLLNYYLNDSRNVTIANSTLNNNNLSLILSTLHHTYYIVPHTHDTIVPTFISEVTSYGKYNGEFEFIVSISIPFQPIYLGKWHFWGELLDSDNNLILSFFEDFIITDYCNFVSEKILVYTPFLQNEWSDLTNLSPSKVSPGDHLVIVGHVYDEFNGTIVPISEVGYRYSSILTMGSLRSYFNASCYNDSLSLHSGLKLLNDSDQVIIPINVTSIDFRGVISLDLLIEIDIDWFNKSVVEVLSLNIPVLSLVCDFIVRANIHSDIPATIRIGDDIYTEIECFASKIYYSSILVSNQFSIEDLNIKLYYVLNGSNSREKKLNWYQEGTLENNVVINHKEFGSDLFNPYAYHTGEYFINVTWNHYNLPIFNSSNVAQTINYSFTLKESFGFTAYLDPNGPINPSRNITLHIDDNLKIQFHILYLPSRVIASYDREVWLGPNDSVQWSPIPGYGGTKAFEFEKNFVRKIVGIEIWAWIRHTNGSILKTDDSIWCYFKENYKVENTPSYVVSLEDIFHLLIVGLIFGIPLSVFLDFMYKMKKIIDKGR
jgi:hypothetical protein